MSAFLRAEAFLLALALASASSVEDGSDTGAADDPPRRASADLIRGMWAPPERSGLDDLVTVAGSDIMNGGDCAGDDVIDGRPAQPLPAAAPARAENR